MINQNVSLNNIIMKKIFTVIFLIMLGNIVAHAQYSGTQPSKEATLSTNFFGQVLADGKKLSNEELTQYLNAYQYADIKTPLRKTKRGLVDTCVGVGLIAASLGMGASDSDVLVGFFAYPCFMGGLVTTCVGVPKFLTNKAKVKKAIKGYNEANSQPTVSFGPQQYGYGVALRF